MRPTERAWWALIVVIVINFNQILQGTSDVNRPRASVGDGVLTNGLRGNATRSNGTNRTNLLTTNATGTLTGSHLDPMFRLAYQESLGFFTDIPNDAWRRRRNITHGRAHYAHVNLRLRRFRRPVAWYQINWDPDFACVHEDKIGGNNDGHGWVCDPHRLRDKPDCLVYSVGSNNTNFMFELHMKRLLPNCDIHIFDPADSTTGMKGAGLDATYHPWGLAASYTTKQSDTENSQVTHLVSDSARKGKFRTLEDTMEELGHTGRRVDIFKIDCEGCEWKTHKDFLKQDIRQILVETHEVVPSSMDFFDDIHDAGYVMFHKEPNIQHAAGRCIEFAFLKLAPEFFRHSK